jgi:hypothetical protein
MIFYASVRGNHFFVWGRGGVGAQCCDVAKVAMTHKNRFSQIWLQAKYESKIFKTSFYFFLSTYTLTMYRNLSIFLFKRIMANLNTMPNAQVCVYLTVHITKLQLQTTYPKPLYIPHSACIHQDPDR